jgi:hypothetical protein
MLLEFWRAGADRTHIARCKMLCLLVIRGHLQGFAFSDLHLMDFVSDVQYHEDYEGLEDTQ